MMNGVSGFDVADSDNSATVRAGAGVATITATRQQDAIVLTVSGEIDMTTAPTLENAVRQALTARPAILVIDLTDVEFFSSAGIAVLVLAHRNESGADLRVIADDRTVLRPLELTGLTDDFAIYRDVDAALRT